MMNSPSQKITASRTAHFTDTQSPVDDDVILSAVNVVHRYGDNLALDNVSLNVKRGEFLVILGESGSGKTTMLRVISGLEQATAATTLTLDGVDLTNVPAAQRNCTTVFQNYALFPHMSVEENVAYGLKLRKVPTAERQDRTRKALEMVRLAHKGHRRISQLSGGERQRVALARAIITKPAVLLLDEPLGALDERLRYDMQAELVELHQSLGMTFIYITHSQEEALTMSDRIVLMRRGRIEQCGTAEELFDRPVSRFSAEFMGFDNVVECKVVRTEAENRVVVDMNGITMTGFSADLSALQPGDDALIAFRAERLLPVSSFEAISPEYNILPCTPHEHLYRGKYTDRTAKTEYGYTMKIRTWDQHQDQSTFNGVICRMQDCVVLRN
ncbi:ABC transporter ATP-binding protein [Pantoea cypripedii]|uniref:Spermidine/putrescine ABC transporter ATP-binding protein n=1 Tax=Pantoea cypripedii TaxID=55209 RepID=A0A6B9GC42_PANCY|nr:ABC transporter ATP-binding protein [Pantoea cypripedii]QGY32940.1 spermidine/putrescine ABC transporter ATP-binding protein [Pantoea cypripedii]